jgi:hypothetical protein
LTDLFASRASLLAAACDRDLGDPDLWVEPDGYPESLALCIIDSIYSTGAHYTSVRNVIDRYRAYRSDQGGEPNTDGVEQLLKTIEDLGGPDPWAASIGNRRPTSTAANAPLKAEAIHQVATTLGRLGIKSADDLRVAARDEALIAAKAAWIKVPGQRSGITWEYALMLARIPGVKAAGAGSDGGELPRSAQHRHIERAVFQSVQSPVPGELFRCARMARRVCYCPRVDQLIYESRYGIRFRLGIGDHGWPG